MKHAGSDALDRIEPLLQQLRALDGLVEKTRGHFYRRSRGFLHFHEDPSGLHVDVRLEEQGDFARFRVETEKERAAVLKLIRSVL